jgi:hypothetical protein
MKKLSVLVALMIIVAFCAPAHADAANPSNPEKNIGNLLCAPFRIVATPLVAVSNLVQGKPAKMLTIPRDVRRETFDGVESLVRVPFAEAIAKEDGEMGAVNAGITKAKLDWLVDGVLYGVAGGTLWWNANGVEMTPTLCEQAWTAGVAIGAGTVLMDVGGAALESAD